MLAGIPDVVYPFCSNSNIHLLAHNLLALVKFKYRPQSAKLNF